MVDQVGCCLHNGPHRVEGTRPLGSVEWSSLKYDGVKLLEWSPKVEWTCFSWSAPSYVLELGAIAGVKPNLKASKNIDNPYLIFI